MKITKKVKIAAFIAAVFVNGAAFAYSPEMEEQYCKKPHFTDFNLTEYKAPENVEIAPESELSFKVSVWTNPETIKLTAKKQALPLTIESTTSFHRVKTKLPAEFNGSFVRINATAKAVLGCHEEVGWLVKVAEK